MAASVNEFLDRHGDGVYTVVSGSRKRVGGRGRRRTLRVDNRFRQSFSGDGSYLDEIDMSVLGLPVTLLDTNLP